MDVGSIKGGLKRLKHEIMASFPLDSHPELLNTNKASAG